MLKIAQICTQHGVENESQLTQIECYGPRRRGQVMAAKEKKFGTYHGT